MEYVITKKPKIIIPHSFWDKRNTLSLFDRRIENLITEVELDQEQDQVRLSEFPNLVSVTITLSDKPIALKLVSMSAKTICFNRCTYSGCEGKALIDFSNTRAKKVILRFDILQDYDFTGVGCVEELILNQVLSRVIDDMPTEFIKEEYSKVKEIFTGLRKLTIYDSFDLDNPERSKKRRLVKEIMKGVECVFLMT
jgi:hypothetical protein